MYMYTYVYVYIYTYIINIYIYIYIYMYIVIYMFLKRPNATRQVMWRDLAHSFAMIGVMLFAFASVKPPPTTLNHET